MVVGRVVWSWCIYSCTRVTLAAGRITGSPSEIFCHSTLSQNVQNIHPTREKCFLGVWTMPLHSSLFPTSPSPLHLKLKTITTERCTAPLIFFQTYTRSPAPTAPFSTFLFFFKKKKNPASLLVYFFCPLQAVQSKESLAQLLKGQCHDIQ